MSDDTIFRVVVNARAQLALWPLGKPPPVGWYRTSMAGAREQCCRYIDRLPAGSGAALFEPTQQTWHRAPGPRLPPSLIGLIDRLGSGAAQSPAVRDDHSRLDFGQLRQRCTAVAEALAGAGVTDGERVVVCLPPGVDFVVAALGVLKAGGVCVAVAPEVPSHFRDAVITEAQASVALTGGAPERLGDASPGAVSPADGRPALLLYAHPAYGDPVHGRPAVPLASAGAGLIWDHRQLAALAAVTEAAAGRGFERIVLRHRIGSPLLPVGLIWSLSRGAEAVLGGGQDLDRRPGTMTLTELSSASAGAGAGAGAGEFRALLWSNSGAPVTLAGFTGAIGLVTVDAAPTGPGRPLPGVRLLVLDDDLTTVGLGEPGRLYLAGWPVGAGYVARPGLTAWDRLPDPTGPPGSRMLDTGLTARRTAGGTLAYQLPE
jgi:non-ribosomal peptide synthetase component F